MAADSRMTRRKCGEPLSVRFFPRRRNHALVHQDTLRKVVFGQVSDPVFPTHSDAPECSEAELMRQFEADAPPVTRTIPRVITPMGRLLVLLAIAFAALGSLLWLQR